MMEFVAALIIALLLRLFVFHITVIRGRSMLPALRNGDWTLVSRWGLWFGEPRRGDVVICFFPGRKMKRLTFLRQPMVKRVIGLPGETIEIIEGAVHIDGRILQESYLDANLCRIQRVMLPVTLGEKQYFVMGDNRDGSNDSRRVGAIERRAIVGRVVCVVWPLRCARKIQ